MASDMICSIRCRSLGCSRLNARLLNDLRTLAGSIVLRRVGSGDPAMVRHPGVRAEFVRPAGPHLTALSLSTREVENGTGSATTADNALHSFMLPPHSHLLFVNINYGYQIVNMY